jgi:hypothetical protein
MKRDLTPEQLAQPVNLTLPLGAVLRLAELEGFVAPATRPVAGRYDIVHDCLPSLGATFKDGIYAGLTIYAGQPEALVLLPGDEKWNWKDGTEWAKQRGGVLPSRLDAMILYQNLKGEFDKDSYYWTSEEYAGYADFAWFAGFSYGSQFYGHKGDDYRCRAVRRVAI